MLAFTCIGRKICCCAACRRRKIKDGGEVDSEDDTGNGTGTSRVGKPYITTSKKRTHSPSTTSHKHKSSTSHKSTKHKHSKTKHDDHSSLYPPDGDILEPTPLSFTLSTSELSSPIRTPLHLPNSHTYDLMNDSLQLKDDDIHMNHTLHPPTSGNKKKKKNSHDDDDLDMDDQDDSSSEDIEEDELDEHTTIPGSQPIPTSQFQHLLTNHIKNLAEESTRDNQSGTFTKLYREAQNSAKIRKKIRQILMRNDIRKEKKVDLIATLLMRMNQEK